MTPGRFITLEGGEGAGKSSNVAFIRDYLLGKGLSVLCTREPGGNTVAEAIREVLLNPALPGMHADTELLLMFAARNEHVQHTILPALKTGTWVVCDRFTDASYAYQGFGRGLPLERISQLEHWVQGAFRPDLTVLFDIEVAAGLQRVAKRSADAGVQTDRFEREPPDFFERIRQGYLQRARQSPRQYRIVDASRPLDAVQADLLAIIGQFYQQQGAG